MKKPQFILTSHYKLSWWLVIAAGRNYVLYHSLLQQSWISLWLNRLNWAVLSIMFINLWRLFAVDYSRGLRVVHSTEPSLSVCEGCLSHWLWWCFPSRWLHRGLHSPPQTDRRLQHLYPDIKGPRFPKKYICEIHLFCPFLWDSLSVAFLV